LLELGFHLPIAQTMIKNLEQYMKYRLEESQFGKNRAIELHMAL